MLASAYTLFPLGVLPSAVGWLGSFIAIAGVITICVLAWKLWQAQRHYALELAEQARQVAEEADKAFQLLREKEVLSRESQAKSEMLATLSREVRSNLNGIVGAADLMLDASLSAMQREHLSTMRASAEAMHQSLNDILDYSSIETGKLRIVPGPFALREPLIEVVEHLSPLAALKELELVLIVARDVPAQVSGDAARLRQILLNLMSNSVRFTPSGRVVLRVEFPQGSKAATSQGATWLHFSVSDTGPGIPEEQQATLFDRYAHSTSASPRKFGGSGLDLAIAKRLVELMGGKIGVRRLPESGSEFWAVLPLGVEPAPAEAPTHPLKGMHVVVLDDLAASRVAISALLAQLGVEQDGTDSVAAAADLLRDAREAGTRDLALLIDESVARDSADEVTRLLSSQAVMLGTKIILMAKDPDSVATAQHPVPTSAILRKPVLRTELLLKALKSAPTSAAPAARPALLRTPHVLVVDDDEISRSVTAQLLDRLGCKVDRATSGAEAISSAKATRYDLIFMDCQMPEMDGFVTTERILAASPGSAPPIVALTASTTTKDRERCFAAGMCDFVDKPARKVELDRVLKRWTQAEQP